MLIGDAVDGFDAMALGCLVRHSSHKTRIVLFFSKLYFHPHASLHQVRQRFRHAIGIGPRQREGQQYLDVASNRFSGM